MEKIKGNIISQLPFQGLKKVSDLIEYDGPILSHFRDEYDNDYLYYWVDFNESVNRWLVWKIDELHLYKYLKGTESLKELLENKDKDFVYSIEIDSELQYKNIAAVYLNQIPEKYQIEEESTYKLDIPKLYLPVIEKYESDFYLTTLRELSLEFTLEPSNHKYSTTISALDAGIFLKKLCNSYLNFIQEDFFSKFKHTFGDYSRLQKVVGQFKEILTPRIVELEYGSFKVSIGSDFTHTVGNDEYNKWQREILNAYKEEVIDVDYSSSESLNRIAEKYEVDARRRIYGPYLDILNDKDYKVEVTNYKKTFRKVYNRVETSKRKILIPETIENNHDNEKRKLYSVVLELDEKQDIKNISTKGLKEGLLFSQEMKDVEIIWNEIDGTEYYFELNQPFKFIFTIDNNNSYKAENKEFGLEAIGSDKDEVFQNIIHQFEENYIKITNGDFAGDSNPYSTLIKNAISLN